eukprot:c7507_g1_i1.p1 GENE.c7507_g1_i1~~c7507_g1_i1.p1  ORF type:complete len:265 (+),score=45.30 c7507_g1_i1:57-851(+)
MQPQSPPPNQNEGPPQVPPLPQPEVPVESDHFSSAASSLLFFGVSFLIGIVAYFLFWHNSLESIDFNEQTLVTCGSAIKLNHARTSYRLHSHNVRLPYGPRFSGQQSVTCVPYQNNPESLWLVKSISDDVPCNRGDPILKDSKIRLEHVSTGRNLHSHANFMSPLSGNQEVSAFGENGNGDSGDHFQVTWKRGLGDKWRKGMGIRLIHVDTHCALINDPQYVYSSVIWGHTEVSCSIDQDGNSVWIADEGVYFSQQTSGESRAA